MGEDRVVLGVHAVYTIPSISREVHSTLLSSTLTQVKKANGVWDVSSNNNKNERTLHRGGQHLGGGGDARAWRGAGGERDARGGTGAHGRVWHRRGREARREEGVGEDFFFIFDGLGGDSTFKFNIFSYKTLYRSNHKGDFTEAIR